MTKNEIIQSLDELLRCIREYDEMLDRIEENAEGQLRQAA